MTQDFIDENLPPEHSGFECERQAIRQRMFKWAKEHVGFIKYRISDIIDRVYRDEYTLRDVEVMINEQDIEKINFVTDNKKTKLVALAFVCYAKAHKGSDNVFNLSSTSLADWVDINRKTLMSIHVKELMDYGFLNLVERSVQKRNWDQPLDKQASAYKINYELCNSGEYILEKNDIKGLFDKIFGLYK
jgi:hypothetical protein